MLSQPFEMPSRPIDDSALAGSLPGSTSVEWSACTPDVATVTAWQRYGLIGWQGYESPQFGVQATWDHSWSIDIGAAFPIEFDTSCQYDTIRLIWEKGDRFAQLSLSFSPGTEVASMHDLVEVWNDPDYLERNWDDYLDARFLGGQANATTADTLFAVVEEFGEPEIFIVNRTVALNADTWLYLTLTTDEASFEEAWTALHEGVRINGDAIPSVLSGRLIEAVR